MEFMTDEKNAMTTGDFPWLSVNLQEGSSENLNKFMNFVIRRDMHAFIHSGFRYESEGTNKGLKGNPFADGAMSILHLHQEFPNIS